MRRMKRRIAERAPAAWRHAPRTPSRQRTCSMPANASRISRSNSRAPCRPSSATAWAIGCLAATSARMCALGTKRLRTKTTSRFARALILTRAQLISLLELDEIAFERTFGQTALSRPGRAGLLRNAAIVLGNQRDERAVPALERVALGSRTGRPRCGGLGFGENRRPVCSSGVEKPACRRG